MFVVSSTGAVSKHLLVAGQSVAYPMTDRADHRRQRLNRVEQATIMNWALKSATFWLPRSFSACRSSVRLQLLTRRRRRTLCTGVGTRWNLGGGANKYELCPVRRSTRAFVTANRLTENECQLTRTYLLAIDRLLHGFFFAHRCSCFSSISFCLSYSYTCGGLTWPVLWSTFGLTIK